MFGYPCEQTFRMSGCVDAGGCGKDAVTASLQDKLVDAAKAVVQAAHTARQRGAGVHEADVFGWKALFASGTNVNFDPQRLQAAIGRGAAVREDVRAAYVAASGDGAAIGEPAAAASGERLKSLGPDIAGLQELVLYGLKGTAAYAGHARQLGRENDGVYATVCEILAFLAHPAPAADELPGMAMKTGELNLRVMEMLDEANTVTLLPLGVRNIRSGPGLPAFVTPPVLQVLVEKFNPMPIGTVERGPAAIAN